MLAIRAIFDFYIRQVKAGFKAELDSFGLCAKILFKLIERAELPNYLPEVGAG